MTQCLMYSLYRTHTLRTHLKYWESFKQGNMKEAENIPGYLTKLKVLKAVAAEQEAQGSSSI